MSILKFERKKKEGEGGDEYSVLTKECLDFIKEKSVDIIKIKSSKRESDLSIIKLVISVFFINKLLDEDKIWLINDLIESQSEKILDFLEGCEEIATEKYEEKLAKKVVKLKSGVFKHDE